MVPRGVHGKDVCLLGLNTNHGQRIDLRLRTDPPHYEGFQHYRVVKDVLLHELTHNFHGDHDAKFWAFYNQLKVECDELDWTKSEGHRLGGADVYMPAAPAAAAAAAADHGPSFTPTVARLGGDGPPTAGVGVGASVSAANLAAQAAVLRAQGRPRSGEQRQAPDRRRSGTDSAGSEAPS